MPDKSVIITKLTEILSQLKNLRGLAVYSKKTLLAQVPLLYFAERVMERLVGAAVDINYHIIADITGKSPEDYYSSFMQMGIHGIITKKLAEKLAPSTGLRNILVHEYMKIDYSKFFVSLKVATKSYASYARVIQKYIDAE